MSQPNVLLICSDQWAGNLTAAAGHPCIMTPTLDQLAENGVRFTNAYSATPTCIPARRGLMTGTTARTHADRIFNNRLRMPDLPTLAGTFGRAGYQTYAVGKMHVFPQRDRIGFHEVILNEEGRHQFGMSADDYDLFLADQGYAGQQYVHGMCNNMYETRPWHLPEYCHPTNWTAREMSRVIRRRDPTRPAFWYMSFNYPHPPLTPLAEYMDMYRDADIPDATIGQWARQFDALPYALKSRGHGLFRLSAKELRRARQAFYAQCTHIDHQIRVVIGTLREEGLLDDTIIAFVSDHGDMLGNHGLAAKAVFYEDAAKVHLIVVPTADYQRMGHHRVDDRLVELRDVMPTLLDLAGVEIPDSVEGMSLVADSSRSYLYGEHYENDRATRMIRSQRYKLIYYPVGNHIQLFDLDEDPAELKNLYGQPDHRQICDELVAELIKHLYRDDLKWVSGEKLVGLADKTFTPAPDRGLSGQRGWQFM